MTAIIGVLAYRYCAFHAIAENSFALRTLIVAAVICTSAVAITFVVGAVSAAVECYKDKK